MAEVNKWSYSAKLSASENHKGYRVRDADGYWVADVSPRDEDGVKGEKLSQLITASPALYEALKAIAEFCDDPNGSERGETLAVGLSRLLPAARAALALAEGKKE